MGKILEINFYNEGNDYCSSETITGETDQKTDIYFHAHDLAECPEDATLNRDMFNGYQFIETLELGMKIAEEGYTGIHVVYDDVVD